VITAAGADDRVASLVYMAALAPNDDETSPRAPARFYASVPQVDHAVIGEAGDEPATSRTLPSAVW